MKQVVLSALTYILLTSATDANRSSMSVGIYSDIHVVIGCVTNRALRTTTLLPKVVPCINKNILPTKASISFNIILKSQVA